MIKYYNITLPDMVQRLAKNGLLDERAVLNASIAVRRRPGDGQEILILAHYLVNGDQPHSPKKDIYDELILAKESLSVSELLGRFARATKDGLFELSAGLTTEISPPGSVELLPSEEPESGKGARYLIDVRAKTTESLPQTGPIIHYGQMSFMSLEQALRFWIPLRLSAYSDARLGHVVVEVPLAAPRFGALSTPADGVFRVAVEGMTAGVVPELTGVWQSVDARQIEPFARNVTSPRVDLPRPTWAEQVALWLALPDSLVTDYYFENASSCSRTRRTLFPSHDSRGGDLSNVREHIHQGENETVEFKPLIGFEPGKFDELVRTVIAFANKHGGTIYLGIGNHQEILGVDRPLREWWPEEAKKSAAERVQLYCSKARTKISDRVIGNIDFKFEPIPVAGLTVIRLIVAEGKHKPYSDFQTKDMWTRRGANTVKPDTNEVKEMVAAGSRGNGLFDF